MSGRSKFPCSVAILAISVALAGCGGENGKDATELSPEEANIQKALAELSEADRAAAEKQRVCPVSDARLGSMGAPVKITVKGQDVFLCCAGCESAVTSDPDTYLAKINE